MKFTIETKELVTISRVLELNLPYFGWKDINKDRIIKIDAVHWKTNPPKFKNLKVIELGASIIELPYITVSTIQGIPKVDNNIEVYLKEFSIQATKKEFNQFGDKVKNLIFNYD